MDQLSELWKRKTFDEFLILGGGSNILFASDPQMPILKNEILGINLIHEDTDHVLVSVGSGENWHEFVEWCVNRQYGGIENLALIPGSVGAAPVQNIGAYGVEVGDLVKEVHYFDMEDASVKQIDGVDCDFSYRNSIFKNELRNKAFITQVVFSLTRQMHNIQTGYGAIKTQLNAKNIIKPGISDVFETVVSIRQSKLPDPAILGNAGSFFKNPVVDNNILDQLKQKFPSIVSYPFNDKESKLAAGWLIDQAGWKGKRVGNVGCYEKQALVLVNYGNAEGKELVNLAMRIKGSVFAMFGVSLEEEVNVII